MTDRIATGDRLPDARLIEMTEDGPREQSLSEMTAGRTVVLFAVPGAFTPTCDSAHLPSFVRTAGDFTARGVDDILCVSVNDAFVMGHWGKTSGASEAGVRMLADPEAAFSKAMGLTFSRREVGFHDRSQRYALIAEDGIVRTLHIEEPGVCAVSTGEAMLTELS